MTLVRLFIICMCSAAILLNPVKVFGFQNEPQDFRGIKWEARLQDVGGMKRICREKDDVEIYQRKDDRLKVGSADLDFIHYYSYKGKFWFVNIVYRYQSNYNSLKATLFHVYGDGESMNPLLEKYYWRGNKVLIILEFTQVLKLGSITYSYLPILKEQQASKDRKSMDAAADL